jgi:8-hydroxy-5-deazaflavin:NADPH oxidoreductase
VHAVCTVLIDSMSPTTIAVLGGTGQQGGGLAQRLAMAGRSVTVGSRDPGRAAATVAGWQLSGAPVAAADYATAVASADVVIIAVPFAAVDSLLAECRDRFRPNALVIDVVVPVTFASNTVELTVIADGSAAEHIRARLPEHVRLAATFKTVPAHLLNEIDRPLDCDEFVCGDSAEARAEAGAVVGDVAGLRAVDVGPLRAARSIEHLTLLAIRINRRHRLHDARYRVVGF